MALKEACEAHIELNHDAVYVAGRYNKYSRYSSIPYCLLQPAFMFKQTIITILCTLHFYFFMQEFESD